MPAPRPLKERFEEKVNRNGSCHNWRGCVMKGGYGQIHYKGKTVYAHRVAWELTNGTIDDNSYVLHTCDNRKCCNPEHLFLGTFDDNMADMVSKNRQTAGEKNHFAKLTEKQVRMILLDNRIQQEIADEYGVSRSLVSQIKSRKIWRCIDDIVCSA